MAYRIENRGGGKAFVLDGYEAGISDTPFAGIANLKNINIDIPGLARVELETSALTKPPTVSLLAYTTDTTANTITVASTTGWYNGMAITLDTVVTSTGISTGRAYWIGDLTATTFKLYKNPARTDSAVDITGSNGSGTLSSYTLGKPIDKATGQASNKDYPYTFILDENGRAWWIDNTGGTVTTNLVYLGNDTLTGGSGRAVTTFQNHLIVFRSSAMDGVGIAGLEQGADFDSAYSDSTSGGWAYAWDTVSAAESTLRSVLVGQDNIMYYDNGGDRIGSVTETTGDSLDLDDGTSYTKNTAALDLPEDEEGSSLKLAEAGEDLIIGAKSGKIYPWDRTSSSFRIPNQIPEYPINFIKVTGPYQYVAAGVHGRIYQTNGSSTVEFFKFPDHLTDTERPLYTFNDLELALNKLYFGITVTKNDGTTAVTGVDGLWELGLENRVFRLANTLSHATNGTTTLIVKNEIQSTPAGLGLYVGWIDASSGYGVDTGSSNPYNGGESEVEFDALPIGTVKFSTTPTQLEVKLSRSLVTGESIELKYRSEITGSYTSIATFNTTSKFSFATDTTFEAQEWLQIKAVLTSTHTSPSFVPLREIAIYLP